MKMKRVLLLLPALLPLVGCDIIPGISSEDKNTTSDTNKPVSDKGSATENKDESTNVEKAELITVFAINDVHGSLKENADEGELGLAKLEYAIKHDADYDPSTSIIISIGDSWQGGYVAYKEKTLTDELLADFGVEAMCLGNHEFDWGIDTIKDLKAKASFPFLACNIKTPNGAHTNELSDNSTIITKGNVKVGIIGVMGSGQESSIATNSLAGYSFDSRTSIIKDEVDNLNNEGCDLVILAAHDSYTTSSGYVNSIANTFDTTQIQGIFGAHTHTFESTELGTNKMPFVQGGCNTKGYTKMCFSVKGKKALQHSYVKAFNSTNYNVDTSLLNQNIVTKVEEADSKYDGSEEICQLVGDFRRYKELNKFVPEIMLKQAIQYGFKSTNELIALHNLSGIRSDISSGTLTREKLFKVEPFENKVKIIKNVSGSKLASLLGTIEGNYSSSYYAYMRESEESFSSSLTYDVVTIDFVSEGKYGKNCFGSATQYDLRTEKPYILDVMIDYLESAENKVYNATDYR